MFGNDVRWRRGWQFIASLTGLLATTSVVGAAEPAGVPLAIEPLVRDLRSTNWRKRQVAVEQLSGFGKAAEPAVPTLTELLSDTNPPLPKRGEDGWHYTFFVDPGPTVGEQAAFALAAIGPAAEPAVRAALTNHDLHTRCCAAVALGAMGKPDAAVEIATLLPATLRIAQETPNKSAPRKAMILLAGKLRSPRTLDALHEVMLRDTFESNRAAATRSVGQIGGPEAIKLLRAVQNERYLRGVRYAALHELVRLLGKAAKPDVEAAYRGTDGYMQRVAQRLLDDVADSSDVGKFRSMLKHPKADQRRTAAEALASIKSPQATPSLLAALRDSDESVAVAAAQALQATKDPDSAAGLCDFVLESKASKPRSAAMNALANLPREQRTVALCLLLLRHTDVSIRLSAIRQLRSEIGRDANVQATMQIAEQNDRDAQVRLKAREVCDSWRWIENQGKVRASPAKRS